MISRTPPPAGILKSASNVVHVTHFISNPALAGLQTAYYDVTTHASQQSDPILFVHGFTGSKLDFSDQLTSVAQSHRLIAYDQRGHGESSNCGNYSLYSMAADLLGLLDALDIDRCHVVGHSLGGMVVLRALLSDQQRFRSAILMDTAPYGVALMPSHIRRQLVELVTENGCVGLLPGMRSQPPSKAVRRCINYFSARSNPSLGEQEYWRRIEVKLGQMDPEAFVTLSATLAEQPSVLDMLSKLATPCTIMVGSEDLPFLQPAKDMAEAIPHANLRVVDEAGHSPQYENSDAWHAILDAHMTTLSGSS